MRSYGHIPEATVVRLPIYLRALVDMASAGESTVSSEELAELSGVNAPKLRKDLSHLGTYGTRGVGYNVDYLRFEISSALGLGNTWPVMVCGFGNLGRALANHTGFTERGFPILAAVDTDPDKVGHTFDGVRVHAPAEVQAVVSTHNIAIGVICTPVEASQGAADRLVAAGVRSILSFSPIVLTVPDDVDLRSVDLSTELQILGFHLQESVVKR